MDLEGYLVVLDTLVIVEDTALAVVVDTENFEVAEKIEDFVDTALVAVVDTENFVVAEEIEDFVVVEVIEAYLVVLGTEDFVVVDDLEDFLSVELECLLIVDFEVIIICSVFAAVEPNLDCRILGVVERFVDQLIVADIGLITNLNLMVAAVVLKGVYVAEVIQNLYYLIEENPQMVVLVFGGLSIVL